MVGKAVGVHDWLEVVPQPLLDPFERHLFLGERRNQLPEPLRVLLLVLFGGEALPHVKPLEATDGKRRFHSRDHHWDNR
jgi:hypothetical protein